MKEQPEDALEDRARVRLRVAPPVLPVGKDLATSKDGQGQITIDVRLRVEVGVRHRLESLAPASRVGVAAAKGFGREVVETAVVLRQAEAAREHRRCLELLGQELVDQLLKRHGLRSIAPRSPVSLPAPFRPGQGTSVRRRSACATVAPAPAVGRDAAHVRLRGNRGAQVRLRDGLADAEIARDHARPTEGPGEDPLGRPGADAPQRGEPRDDVLVRRVAERLLVNGARGERIGHGDDGARLCRGELEGSDRLDRRICERRRRKAVDDLAAHLVPVTEGLGEPAPGCRGPREVDLLGADRADERRQEIRLQHGSEPRKACVEMGEDGIACEQGCPVRRSRNEGRPNGRSEGVDVGGRPRLCGRDGESGCRNTAHGLGSPGDDLSRDGGGTQQAQAVPAIDQVIAGPAIRLKGRGQVQWGGQVDVEGRGHTAMVPGSTGRCSSGPLRVGLAVAGRGLTWRAEVPRYSLPMRYILVAVLVAAAAVGGYYVAMQANPPLPALKTVAVSRGAIDVSVDITGSVTAKRSRGLAFGTPGTVATVKFAEGDAVKADDVIAALDTSAIDSQLKAAQSALTSARSALKAAQDAVEAAPSPGTSATPAFPASPSRAQLDANVDAAQAAVDSAQAAIDGAKLAQGGAVIRAPFDGSLTQVLIHVGDYVAPGPLGSLGFPVEVADGATRDIVAGASEDDVVKLVDGQAVTVTFDALSDVKLDGAICEIPAVPTPVQGVPTYPVRICLTGSDPAVRLGLTASATVRVARRENVLLVPSGTVHVSGDDHVVNVVTAGGGVVPTTVEVGESDGTITEVLSGVSEGDKVEVPR